MSLPNPDPSTPVEQRAPMAEPGRRLRFPGVAGTLVAHVRHEDASERLPVLLLHPINLRGLCWTAVADELEPRRTAVMPDYRGHGESDADGPFGIEAWGEDAIAALDAAGVERAHVVGGSLGGALAVWLAATVPDRVASIAAFGSAPAPNDSLVDPVVDAIRAKGVRGMFASVLPTISVAPGTSQATLDAILDLTNPNDPDTVIAIWRAARLTDIRDAAARVRCPALVATGAEDRTRPPDEGGDLARRLGVDLVTIDGVGHLPMCEAPGRTARLIADHLDRSEAATETRASTHA